MKSFINQFRMARNYDSVLFWSHKTNCFWALPKSVGTKFELIEIKSFEY